MTDNQTRNDDQSRNRENEGRYGSPPTGKQDPAKNKDKDKEGKQSSGTAGYSSGTGSSQSSQGGMNDKSSSSNT